MKRFLCLFLSGLLLTGALAGCAPTAAPAPTPTPTATAAPAPTAAARAFTLACTSEGPIHPLNSADAMDQDLVPLMYEGLYVLDPHFAPQAQLCSGASVSEDGLTWTFALRPGITFSDGSALTARDVERSLRAARESPLYAARLSSVTGISAGEGAVSLTLSAPNGALPALLDMPIFKEVDGLAVGTGPYIWTEGALTARPGWWQERPLPTDTIALYPAADGEELSRAFDTGDVSMLAVDWSAPDCPGFSGNFQTCDVPDTTMLYLGFRCTDGLLSDGALRAALSRCLDRNTVCSLLLARHGAATTLPLHPAAEGYPPETARALSYSVTAAETALRGLGYAPGEDGTLAKDGRRLTLSLLVHGGNSLHIQTAELLRSDLAARGVAITVKALPWEEYTAALAAVEFDLYLAETRLTADFDPTSLLSGSLNFGGYADPAGLELLSAYRAARGEERAAAADALYRRFVQAPAVAPICFKSRSVLTQWGQAEGLTPARNDLFYGLDRWQLFPDHGQSDPETVPGS